MTEFTFEELDELSTLELNTELEVKRLELAQAMQDRYTKIGTILFYQQKIKELTSGH